MITDFGSYFNSIDNIPVHELSDTEQNDLSDSIEGNKNQLHGRNVAFCLDREQRMIYILGEMFDIDHNLGSEILGISAGNFQAFCLMRARKDLYNWMNDRCGLVNKSNLLQVCKRQEDILRQVMLIPIS